MWFLNQLCSSQSGAQINPNQPYAHSCTIPNLEHIYVVHTNSQKTKKKLHNWQLPWRCTHKNPRCTVQNPIKNPYIIGNYHGDAHIKTPRCTVQNPIKEFAKKKLHNWQLPKRCTHKNPRCTVQNPIKKLNVIENYHGDADIKTSRCTVQNPIKNLQKKN